MSAGKDALVASQTDAEEKLLRYFEVSKEIDDIYSYIARWSGMPESSYWVMFSISDGKTRPKEITEQCSMRKQTVNSALQHLQRNEYITMQVADDDKRGKTISLTAKGEAFITQRIDVVKEIELSSFLLLGKDKIQGLLEGLESFLTTFSKQTETLTNRKQSKKRSSEGL